MRPSTGKRKNDRMDFKPTNPRRSMGETIAASYRLTSAAFSKSWLLGLLIAVSSSLATVYQLSAGDPQRLLEPFPHDPAYWLVYTIGLLLAQYFTATLYLRLDATASGGEGDDALRVALARLPSFVVMNALFVVALIAGTLLLIVPGMILTVSLAISSPIMLFDSKGPLESLRESHRLVRDHWWHTGTVLGIGGLVAIGVFLVCLIAVAILAAFVAHGDVLTIALAATLIVVALTGMVAMPFLLALVLNVYWDLKLRRPTEVGLK
jgi:hypothetical protein